MLLSNVNVSECNRMQVNVCLCVRREQTDRDRLLSARSVCLFRAARLVFNCCIFGFCSFFRKQFRLMFTSTQRERERQFNKQNVVKQQNQKRNRKKEVGLFEFVHSLVFVYFIVSFILRPIFSETFIINIELAPPNRIALIFFFFQFSFGNENFVCMEFVSTAVRLLHTRFFRFMFQRVYCTCDHADGSSQLDDHIHLP